MKKCIAQATVVVVFGLSPCTLLAQGETAVPFLALTTSLRGNGMGGIAATIPSSDASATIANPGQLGLFSLDNLLSASIYSPKSRLTPGNPFPFVKITMSVSALNAGINLTDLFSLPFTAGLGVGYSRTYVDINLGTFNVAGPGGTLISENFLASDTYENVSFGLGLEYFARLGIGMNFKAITSRMPGIGTGDIPATYTATPSATDFGLLLEIPTVAIASKISGTPLSVAKGIEPFLDVSMSYVRANAGDAVSYADPLQSDPLPRTAVVGLGLEGGLTARGGNTPWRVFSFSLVHQAEDLLVVRHNDGTFEYKGGLGDLMIGDNLLVGRVTGKVLVRKGWELGAAEFLYVRGGSVKGQGYDYSTSGYSICLGGFVRLLESVSPEIAETSWVAFIGDHIDLQYHSAVYAEWGKFWDGTAFKGVNLVVHGFSW